MKIVALVSGGKDSCYNMMQCVAAGHDIVALANLAPYNKDELDSYMYQSVAHEGVALMGRAMGIPLYRLDTKGKAESVIRDYEPTENDEVEDLYRLLQKVQADIQFEGVAVGAILSDYQRIRVENVCARLGLISLAYLWQRDQAELLQEMLDCQVEAILVKVATLGLDPSKHLGKTIRQLQPHLLAMKEKYGLNVCGEGGEYETFTLDCPLYINRIVIDDSQMVIHSDNAIAPVGFLRLNKLHLVPKSIPDILKDRLNDVSVKDSDGYITDSAEEAIEGHVPKQIQNEDVCDHSAQPDDLTVLFDHPSTSALSMSGWLWCGGMIGRGPTAAEGMKNALDKLENYLQQNNMTAQDVCAINMFISNMGEYVQINKAYCSVFSHINPPTRVCVQVALPTDCHIILEALAWHKAHVADPDIPIDKQTLHVQGISHWAPANIGPYSQAIRVGNMICVAGQIGLVPGSMTLVNSGIKQQCQLTLRHVGRIIKAIGPSALRDVVQGLCYVTKSQYIEQARCEWEERTNNAIVDYVVVADLPRGALIEWHVWAHKHNGLFEYEETGKCIDDYVISIRRRWNYENNVAAIVCHLSHSEKSGTHITRELCREVIVYTLSKLNQNYETNESVDYLRIFYPMNQNIDIKMIFSELTEIQKSFNFVYTIVPVCSLQDNTIILSICGVRNE